ncbi:hypothetical protein [Streptomyces beijiangensis]
MTDNGKNDPLPVRSQEKAKYDVRALLDLLAEDIGTTVDSKTVDMKFRDCMGKNGEISHDGRFDLSYLVSAPVPRARYNTALLTLRKKLEAGGYRISGYREGEWREILLYAKGGTSNFFISVSASKPPYDELNLSVTTPCFMPPGKHQEQVSAPAPRQEPVAAIPAPAQPAEGPWSANPFG